MPLLPDSFEPHQVPPNVRLARLHEDAFKVGKHPIDSVNRCPCCNTSMEYTLLPLGCDVKELCFLGCAYPFYFYFSKVCLLIIGSVFVLGGALNMLWVGLDCSSDSCVRFLGLAIINYTDL